MLPILARALSGGAGRNGLLSSLGSFVSNLAKGGSKPTQETPPEIVKKDSQKENVSPGYQYELPFAQAVSKSISIPAIKKPEKLKLQDNPKKALSSVSDQINEQQISLVILDKKIDVILDFFKASADRQKKLAADMREAAAESKNKDKEGLFTRANNKIKGVDKELNSLASLVAMLGTGLIAAIAIVPKAEDIWASISSSLMGKLGFLKNKEGGWDFSFNQMSESGKTFMNSFTDSGAKLDQIDSWWKYHPLARLGKATGDVLVSPDADRSDKNPITGLAKSALDAINRPISKHPVVQITDMTLGSLSKKYESNGKPGAVNENKDGKGYSYGEYQLNSGSGTLSKFLKSSGYDAYFKGMTPGSSSFKAKWQEMSKDERFNEAQRKFIEDTHYQPLVKILKSIGFDVESRSNAVKQMVWSIGVQYGTKLGFQMISEALRGKNPRTLSDKEIIEIVYAYRAASVKRYFPLQKLSESKRKEWQKSIAEGRGIREGQQALQMLEVEQSSKKPLASNDLRNLDQYESKLKDFKPAPVIIDPKKFYSTTPNIKYEPVNNSSAKTAKLIRTSYDVVNNSSKTIIMNSPQPKQMPNRPQMRSTHSQAKEDLNNHLYWGYNQQASV